MGHDRRWTSQHRTIGRERNFSPLPGVTKDQRTDHSILLPQTQELWGPREKQKRSPGQAPPHYSPEHILDGRAQEGSERREVPPPTASAGAANPQQGSVSSFGHRLSTRLQGTEGFDLLSGPTPVPLRLAPATRASGTLCKQATLSPTQQSTFQRLQPEFSPAEGLLGCATRSLAPTHFFR